MSTKLDLFFIPLVCFCKLYNEMAEVGFVCRSPNYTTVMKVWVNEKRRPG